MNKPSTKTSPHTATLSNDEALIDAILSARDQALTQASARPCIIVVCRTCVSPLG